MADTNLELTEAINGNVEQTNEITKKETLKVLGAASALQMAMTVDQTTTVIQHLGDNVIDLSFVTASAGDILSGKVGVDAEGNPVNGEIQTVTASLSGNTVTVPQGHIAEKQTLTVAEAKAPDVDGNVVTIYPGYVATEQTVTVENTGDDVNWSEVTAIASDIRQGTAIVTESGVLNGTLPTRQKSDITVNGNQVTFPYGIYDSSNSVSVGTAKATETITPGTVDRIIPADTYLSGDLTIKGDANLVPENIAEGKEIFGVAGSHQGGGGSMDFYKCAAVYGARKVPRIKVENAGTAAVNGEYELTTLKTSSGGEVWKHTEADYYYYSESDYNWGIDADYNMPVYRALYYHDMAEPTSSNSYWNTGYDYDNDKATGIDPAPTVSEIQITVDADVPKTWDGYKAVLTDGIYDFEKELTAGLTYGTSYIPVVGGIYSADALVQVTGLFDNIVNRFPGSAALFALDANKGIGDLVNGGQPTSQVGDEDKNIPVAGEFCFEGKAAYDYAIGDSMSNLKEFTIEMDYTITSNETGYCGFFGNKSSWSTMNCQIQWGRSGYRPAMFWNDYFDTRTGGDEHPEWVNDRIYHHVAMVKKGEIVTLYSDGKAIAKYEGATKSLNLAIENILAVGTQHVENQIFPGRMIHFRVLGEAIYDGDFDIPEWVGVSNLFDDKCDHMDCGHPATARCNHCEKELCITHQNLTEKCYYCDETYCADHCLDSHFCIKCDCGKYAVLRCSYCTHETSCANCAKANGRKIGEQCKACASSYPMSVYVATPYGKKIGYK